MYYVGNVEPWRSSSWTVTLYSSLRIRRAYSMLLGAGSSGVEQQGKGGPGHPWQPMRWVTLLSLDCAGGEVRADGWSISSANGTWQQLETRERKGRRTVGLGIITEVRKAEEREGGREAEDGLGELGWEKRWARFQCSRTERPIVHCIAFGNVGAAHRKYWRGTFGGSGNILGGDPEKQFHPYEKATHRTWIRYRTWVAPLGSG